MVLRPDERANLAELERERRLENTVKSGIKTAAGLAVGAAGAGAGIASGLGSKIMPFLNRYIPADLAIKGINKVSPKLGQFLKKGVSMGLDAEEGLDYIKNNLSQEEQQNKAKESRNIIEQYSPELYSYIKEAIGRGATPEAAAAFVVDPKLGKKEFREIAQKIVKQHKAPWASIVSSIFGGTQQAQSPQPEPPQPPQPQQPQQGQGIDPHLAQLLGGMQAKLQQLRGR